MDFIVEKLKENGKIITCAESCTGGLLSSMLVEKSGVSEVFKGSIVAYSNEIKISLLGVNKTTIEKYGAVSKECVKEMVINSIKLINSDISMAISGVAGPNGGTKEKPVGTVYIGVGNRDGKILIERFNFKGDRKKIQIQASYKALKMVLQLEEKLFF